MRGILDLDVLCLQKIFKFLKPLDFCSLRQSCTQLRDLVDDNFRSLYFIREQWLDLRGENIINVNRILKNFGKLVRRLKVSKEWRAKNLLPDVVVSNCGAMLKGLSLNRLKLYESDIDKFAGICDNLEVLELINCDSDQKCIEQLLLGHEYPNLTTLQMNSYDSYDAYVAEIFQKFFMRKRSIQKLNCVSILTNLLPLITVNGSEIEELGISPENSRHLMSVVQLRKLKRLEFGCYSLDQESIIALIKELSVNNQLEMLGIDSLEFTDEFFDALSNLTNLKEIQLWHGECKLNDTKSLEMLGRKLSKLESLMLVNCADFPYRNFLVTACKSDKFRKIYVHAVMDSYQTNNFTEQVVKDFIEGRGHRCFVSGDPLCIYIGEYFFNQMKGLLTQHNLQSIEKYGNIKILRVKDDVWFGF